MRFQHLARVGEQLAGAVAHHLVLEDLGVIAGELPGAEERRPVDALDQLVQRVFGEDARVGALGVAVHARLGRHVGRPVDLEGVGARHRERHQLFLAAGRALHPDGLVFGRDVAGEVRRLRARLRDQRGANADGAAGVEHVHGGAFVAWCDPERGVDLRGRGAADQQRHLEALARHLLGHRHHLVERGRDQAREADHVGLVVVGGLEDFLERHHDAEIDDLEIVALEHDADDVLADVVDVALDRGHDDLALGLRGLGMTILPLGFEASVFCASI